LDLLKKAKEYAGQQKKELGKRLGEIIEEAKRTPGLESRIGEAEEYA